MGHQLLAIRAACTVPRLSPSLPCTSLLSAVARPAASLSPAPARNIQRGLSSGFFGSCSVRSPARSTASTVVCKRSVRRGLSAMASSSADAPELVEGGGPYDWDLLTIGIGSGGTRASRVASSLGAKVAAVELPFNPISSETAGGVGGTCVLRGCVPKKILMYGSSFSAEFQDAAGYGWELPGPPTFNWKKLLTEKTREIERLNGVYKRILGNAGVTLFEGRGVIVDPHTIEIQRLDGTKERHTAKNILVAVGGRPTLLDVPGKEYVITSDEALSLDELPKSAVVIGSGYIAVEFAGIFNGLGVKADLLYRQPLPLRGFDLEMRKVVAANLAERGITLHTERNTAKVEKLEDGRLKLTTDKGEEIITDIVMMATGRAPNTRHLGLENVGVELDKHGAIKVSEFSQTNIKSIWAIGDVTNRLNLTPVALMEGTCLANTLFGGQPMKPDFLNVASAVFCQPPLSVVGMSEEQAVQESENDILIFTSSFNPMKNTISGRQEKTYMKLIVDAVTDRVLGAGMCGPDSAEIMQGLGITLKCNVTKKQFDSTVGIHPTAAEEFVTMRTPTRRVPGMKKAKATAGAAL